MTNYDFSISRHTQFIAGYLDAVGRTLTTDHELVSLTCVSADESPLGLIGYKNSGILVDDWSSEFCTVANDFLRDDARSRLGFYLVEYLCWFKSFTQDASCYRCAVGDSDVGTDMAYRIAWPDGSGVIFMASRSNR